MKKLELELIKFIKENEDWREVLSASPYFISIKEEDGFIIFKYDQVYSDFSKNIVKECRGIILDKDYNAVCVPFYKFFNYGESFADKIDWSTARVQQKVDGSILKLWYYDGRWRLSTNGSIDAYKTHLPDNFDKAAKAYDSFGKLFESATNYKDLDYNKLDKECTYMFELTSPFNKVVIYYPETTITHIGTRNNLSGEELNVDIGIKKPKQYSLGSLKECLEAADELPSDEEGYVVVDAAWRRIKVKNPLYLRLHRMICNNVISLKTVLNILLENEQGEFLNYFPEYKSKFDDIEKKINEFKIKVDNTEKELRKHIDLPRKEYAMLIMNTDKDNSYYYFRKINEPTYSIEKYIRAITMDRLIEKLGFNDEE